MKAILAFCSFLAVGGFSSSQLKIPSVDHERREDLCPPCELLFRKLERNTESGKLAQVVRVQERGEPKSGTSLMLDWATGALDRTCIYLQQLYGEATCLSGQLIFACLWYSCCRLPDVSCLLSGDRGVTFLSSFDDGYSSPSDHLNGDQRAELHG